ncbi:hypothetical protein EC960939_0966, partial [Escherichia coli 96.0939]
MPLKLDHLAPPRRIHHAVDFLINSKQKSQELFILFFHHRPQQYHNAADQSAISQYQHYPA